MANDKVAGAQKKCHSCGSPLICEEKTFQGKTSLSWRNLMDRTAHYQRLGEDDTGKMMFGCNTPAAPGTPQQPQAQQVQQQTSQQMVPQTQQQPQVQQQQAQQQTQTAPQQAPPAPVYKNISAPEVARFSATTAYLNELEQLISDLLGANPNPARVGMLMKMNLDLKFGAEFAEWRKVHGE